MEINAIVQKLLIETALEGTFIDISNEMMNDAASRKETETILINQLTDIKYMIQAVMKDNNQNQQRRNNKRNHKDRGSDNNSEDQNHQHGVVKGDSVGCMEEVEEEEEQVWNPVTLSSTNNPMDAVSTNINHTSALIVDTSDAININTPTATDNTTTDNNTNSSNNNKSNPAVGILAQLFVNIHQTQEADWDELSHQISTLMNDCQSARRAIWHWMRDDMHSITSQEVESVFIVREGDDAVIAGQMDDLKAQVYHIIHMQQEMVRTVQMELQCLNQQYNTSSGSSSNNNVTDESLAVGGVLYGGWSEADHQLFLKV